MSSMFRSEDMCLCQLYLQQDALYDFVKELGEMGIVQFKDLNPDVSAFQRRFVSEVRRCEEMDRQLRYFQAEMAKEKMKIPVDPGFNVDAPEPPDLAMLEAEFSVHEEHLKEVTANIDQLRHSFFQLTELKSVLKHAQELFVEHSQNMLLDAHDALNAATSEVELVEMEAGKGEPDSLRMQVEFVTGVVPQEKLHGFMRILWLVCRGNELMRYTEMEDVVEDIKTGEPVRKSVFVIFFQGHALETRVKKICQGYHCNLYPCPETSEQRLAMLEGVKKQLSDMTLVLDESKQERRTMLRAIGSKFQTWQMKVKKAKAIYHAMNMFNEEGRHFVAEAYCPTRDLENVGLALKKASQVSQTALPSLIHQIESDTYPTFHRTNKFTAAFQTVIDAYGIANYKEVNPAPYSIITFPFLFAVMFGDAGHGVIMLFFALWMVLQEKKLAYKAEQSEITSIFFGGRYLILLMAIFSIYTGVLYNDAFSKSMNIFGTSWHPQMDHDHLHDHHEFALDPTTNGTFSGIPYYFGIDPIWQISRNKITFANSFKKKISIVFGVMQMLLGVVLSLFNHIHFKQPENILCEFLPMLLFQLAIFGYLAALILAKWVVFAPSESGCAPSLLIGLINMFLMKYPKEPCSVSPWYPHMQEIQYFLLAVVAICIPWMLLIKPFYLKRKNRLAGNTEFDFAEVFIHQAIHTIEYCLGCVSHTASYLRLWALSLAHTQLAEVLWNMVFKLGLKFPGYAGAAGITILFAPWAIMTVVILLLMEGMSAFLHTLRLHWVEFQSKFYYGEGFAFEPFSFTKTLLSDDDPPGSK